MRAAAPNINKVGRCKPCGRKRTPCQLCSNVKNTSTFKSKHLTKEHQIKKSFKCNSKIVAYLIECRVSGKQCIISSVTKFPARANNHKSTHRNFRKEQKLNQKPVTRNVFTSIIYRVVIAGFMTGALQ